MTQEYTFRFTEAHELGDGLGPDTYSNAGSPWASGWDCLSNHQRAIYVAYVGTMGAATTWTMAIYEAQDATGTNAQILKVATQLTQAGGDAESSVCIEVRTEELTLLGCSNYPPVATTRWTEIVD